MLEGAKQLRRGLKMLNERYPRPDLPPLRQSKPYCMVKDWAEQTYYPSSHLPGVYAFLDRHGELIYIGKASGKNTIAGRLGQYFRYGTKGTAVSRQRTRLHVAHIITIGLPEDRAFEAPAIEEFLIRELKPRDNNHGTT